MTAPRLAILGATGRMGRAVIRLASEAGSPIVAAIAEADAGRDAGELAGLGPIGLAVSTDLAVLAEVRPDVVVDFSAPAAIAAACDVCRDARVAIVSGTTGLGARELARLDRAAEAAPVLWEPNMSVGVHVLASLLERALASLGGGYDVEVLEVHHRAKVDAPSGTALRLGEIARRARDGAYVHGREGKPGPRRPTEVGMHALRGGDVVGDHTVFLLGDGERLELTHRATHRDLFAHGALRAARWIAGRPPGRYGLADVLGSSSG